MSDEVEYDEIKGSENLFRQLKLMKNRNEMDCQGMMGHILQCIMALNIMSKANRSASSNIVFKEAVVLVLEGLVVENQVNDCRVIFLLQSITPPRNESKKPSWYPLDWAILLCDKIGEKVVQDIYDDDPLALSQSHYLGKYIKTSVHLLCASKFRTSLQQTLLDGFIIRNPNAFTMSADGFGALHVLARYSSDFNLFRAVIQLAPSEVKSKGCGDLSPFNILMENRFMESDEWLAMVQCLLDIDNSPEVVHAAVTGCFRNIKENSTDYNRQDEQGNIFRSKAVQFIDKVLNNCPAAVITQNHKSDSILVMILKLGEDLTESFIFDIMKVIVLVDKAVIQQLDVNRYLPVHYAAQYAGISCVSFLSEEYPESATFITRGGNNILHCAMFNPSEEVITYLCDRYPELNKQYNVKGCIPLHKALTERTCFSLKFIHTICINNPELVKLPMTTSKWLPLHLLIQRYRFGLDPVSAEADLFRLFLRIYPAAANIKNSSNQTPCDLITVYLRDSDFLRLLLRADVTINPLS